ncbi:MAG: nucleotidyltransferase family protein [Fusicatenibacter sp.]|nr:nucleotidyltransferase family protein [Fusicatenibacter sp.]
MKINMIYLAAGNSRRFGGNKLYSEIDGKPMFLYGLHALEAVLTVRQDTVLTVVSEYSRIREYVEEKKKIYKERMILTGSPEREKGISYSIRAGLAVCEADYYLFCVADQPWICHQTVLELIEKTVDGGYAGGYVTWQDTSGNPAIFSAALYPKLMALEGDTGGKKILKKRSDVCTVCARKQKELKDVDDRRAWKEALEGAGGSSVDNDTKERGKRK